MLLEELIKPLKPVSITGTTAGIEISDLVCDSRHMVKGAMFVAVRGVAVDSHKFIPQVVADGAAAVVCEQLPEEVAGNVCYIVHCGRKQYQRLGTPCLGMERLPVGEAAIGGSDRH